MTCIASRSAWMGSQMRVGMNQMLRTNRMASQFSVRSNLVLATSVKGVAGSFASAAVRNPAARTFHAATCTKEKVPIGKVDKPTYQLTFTCKACDGRSSHLVSKQAYHNGTVLIQCPTCKNRHLISDHLKIFGDKGRTLEDILAEKGDKVTRGSIDADKLGDLQWEGDGHVHAQLTSGPEATESETAETAGHQTEPEAGSSKPKI